MAETNGKATQFENDIQTKIKNIGKEKDQLLKNHTYDERYKWIQEQKTSGDKKFKDGAFNDAVDMYMQALCGLNFARLKPTKTQLEDIEKKLKIPILSNMALTLIQMKNHGRAINLLDQILKIDAKNDKAILRKCHVLIDLKKIKECEKLVEIAKEIAFDSEKSQALYKEIKCIEERIKNPDMPQKLNGNT